MKSFNEIELKLRLPNVNVGKDIIKDESILEYCYSKTPEIKQFEAIYLDSLEGDLKKAGFAYRIRKEGNQWVATIKTKGTSTEGLHTREEWNKEIEMPLPSIEYFKDSVIYPGLEKALGKKDLVHLFTTKFERSILNLEVNKKSKIELALDIGEIVVSEKREIIAEVELELKHGEIDDLNLFGDMLMNKYKLLPEDKSKFHRGLLLMKSK